MACTRYFIFVVIGCLCLYTHAGVKDVGIPFLINHSRVSYGASTQNWNITQNSRGYMYFANNDGVLEYDGTNWQVYPVPNGSVVRSVLAVGDTIYAGAFEEIGFLAPGHAGKLKWNSLNHLVPEEFVRFDEVWNIFSADDKLIFQSFNYIFILEEGEIKVIEPLGDFSFMHEADGEFWVVDSDRGFMKLQEDSLELISQDPVFFQNEINCVFSHSPGTYLIGSSNDGLFLLDNQGLSRWDVPVTEWLNQYNLFSGIRLSDGYFAFGSVSNGVFITNSQGNVVQHLNRSKGLQNNTILALFQDSRDNLWLGLDNGIDYIKISSPLTIINHNYNIESAYASILHDGMLYIGTNQGLFAAPWEYLRNTPGRDNLFRLIEGTEGQVWSLQLVDNTLFCGHNFGFFRIEGYDAYKISEKRGFWSFMELIKDEVVLAGTYSGLSRLVKEQQQWLLLDEVQGFEESSRDIYQDKRGYIWVSHGYRGLFKLELSPSADSVQRIEFFRDEAGLPGELPYNLQEFNNQLVFSTRNGILLYDEAENRFVPHPELNSLFQTKGFIDKFYQDDRGNIWYFTDNYVGVMRLLEDGTFRDIMAPFSAINDFLLPAFQNIHVIDPSNIFIGTQYGLVHYDPAIVSDYQRVEDVFFREVTFYGKDERLSFFPAVTDYMAKIDYKPHLPWSSNSVMFRFTTPAFEDPEKIRFSYRLKGFEESWSDWESVNFKEYTNLREGDYVFQVKAKNAFGLESRYNEFRFSVAPPFYRSLTAYIVYSAILLVIIAANIYYIRKRSLRVRQKEKLRHEKRLARREQIFQEQSALSEKEIMKLRNESLQSEMNHKNKELANATLHLIQKNKTLAALKTDLNKLMKATPSDKPEKQIVNSLVKKVNKDMRNEKNWELFNSYFDEVHQDFINRLKIEYPDLTPKELRLCAYLRMNLSTKEIAPLMNISIRGVEISRYRLRKKLNLPHNTNLAEFILSY